MEELDVVLGRGLHGDGSRGAADRHSELVFEVRVYGALDDGSVEAGDDGFEEDVLIENERHVIEQPQAAQTKNNLAHRHAASFRQLSVHVAFLQGEHAGAQRETVAVGRLLEGFDSSQEEGRRRPRRDGPTPIDHLDAASLHGQDVALAGQKGECFADGVARA